MAECWSGREHQRLPLAYTPQHLVDKILAARVALEGERKRVTVLFADLKGSTELIAGLDPQIGSSKHFSRPLASVPPTGVP